MKQISHEITLLLYYIDGGMGNDRLLERKKAVEGGRRHGRPTLRWGDCVKRNLKNAGVGSRAWERGTEERCSKSYDVTPLHLREEDEEDFTKIFLMHLNGCLCVYLCTLR